jgi:hypothetical protein
MSADLNPPYDCEYPACACARREDDSDVCGGLKPKSAADLSQSFDQAQIVAILGRWVAAQHGVDPLRYQVSYSLSAQVSETGELVETVAVLTLTEVSR